MSPATQNVLLYFGIGALAAAGGVLLTQLEGTDPINWKPVIAAALSAFLTALGTMRLTRVGSEGIASRVDELRERGVSRRDMVVLDTKTFARLAAADQQGRRKPTTGLGG